MSEASGRSRQEKKGSCAVCKSTIRLTSGGLIYNHGHGAKCAGVGLPPLGDVFHLSTPQSSQQPPSDIANQTTIPQSGSNESQSPSVSSQLCEVFKGPPCPVIKWIPRAARVHCASVLAKVIMSVTNNPESEKEWASLLLIGRRLLSRPNKDSNNRNLSSIIIKRCGEFTNSSSILIPGSQNEPPKTLRNKK